MRQVFSELIQDSSFPDTFDIGPSKNQEPAGFSGNWIIEELAIPATEIALSHQNQNQTSFAIMEQNMNLLENTFDKIGNEIEITPIGYKNVEGAKNKYEFVFKANNLGLSD